MPPERDLMHRTPTAEIHEVFSLNKTTAAFASNQLFFQDDSLGRPITRTSDTILTQLHLDGTITYNQGNVCTASMILPDYTTRCTPPGIKNHMAQLIIAHASTFRTRMDQPKPHC